MVIEERERERRVFLVETNISLNCKFGQFKHFGRFRPATNLLLMDDVLWPPLLATATTYRRTLCTFPPLRNVFDGTCLRLNRLKHKKLQCLRGHICRSPTTKLLISPPQDCLWCQISIPFGRAFCAYHLMEFYFFFHSQKNLFCMFSCHRLGYPETRKWSSVIFDKSGRTSVRPPYHYPCAWHDNLQS